MTFDHDPFVVISVLSIILIDCRIYVNGKDKHGRTPLHIGIKQMRTIILFSFENNNPSSLFKLAKQVILLNNGRSIINNYI